MVFILTIINVQNYKVEVTQHLLLFVSSHSDQSNDNVWYLCSLQILISQRTVPFKSVLSQKCLRKTDDWGCLCPQVSPVQTQICFALLCLAFGLVVVNRMANVPFCRVLSFPD
jgi:hypothetical protein